MKKFVIIPEEKHRASTNAVQESNREILQSIQQPVQREMLRRYQTARGILRDDSKQADRKMNEYQEAMNDFALLRDRIGRSQHFKQPKMVKKEYNNDTARENGEEDQKMKSDEALKKDDDEDIDMESVSLLPVNVQNNAKKLMKYLRDRSNVTWKKGGEVSIDGAPLRGANITDLVSDVVHRTKLYSSSNLKPFLSAMVKANIPETLVKNKTVLENYREIKNDALTTTMPPITEELVSVQKASVKWDAPL